MPDATSRWAPQPGPQTEAITATWCPELFYGGAAGGGKSDLLLGDFLQDVPTYGRAWQGILFRRTNSELEELLKRSREIYPASGGEWFEARRSWEWSNGAVLKLRYLERDQDATRYQGHQYTWIGWDELTQWPSLFAYRYLRARLRSAKPVPTKRVRAAANPGGVGHHEVKAYFIDPAPGGFTPIVDEATGLERMFIPAKLTDNRELLRNDPNYEGRLKGLGSEALVRAWLEGDWSVVEGAFFDRWSDRNVCVPFEVPKEWARFRSFDWGFAKPFSVGWWAVATDRHVSPDGKVVPRGALVRYREWYGSDGKPNVGLRLTAEEIAERIAVLEDGETIAYGVADPSIFSEDGGPSHAERMGDKGVDWIKADNKRPPGWDQLRARILGDDDGPGLVVFNTCRDFIRTVPALQHDPAKAEDLDTDGEDHAGDEARYACMSRPYIRETRSNTEPRKRYAKAKPGRSAWI